MYKLLQGLFYAGSVALVLSILSPALAQQPEQPAQGAVITWSANLEGQNEAPAVKTQATAQAEFEFDFRKQEVAVKITGQNLREISKISLGAGHTRGELKAAAAKLVLYDVTKDGPLPEPNAAATAAGRPPLLLSKTFSGSAFKEIADAVLNGQGVVEVHTKAHPGGELIGLVQMQKSYK